MTMHTSILPFQKNRKSPPLTAELAAQIKALLNYGLSQQDIATITGLNQGRVSEVNTGMKYPGIEPAQLEFTFH